ncbi:VOC family protein [Paenibacillus sp. KQZ6P-2]|uniref:VOC family protein n=1 Tax=Paenibacillus mangrovi TaxID=2931978 RepID=A0A9X2B409_9BACL|nr:VOC family protein [Paenibacillus mangrovi]MCJ8013500.1 VOC family protein [Paenibacillus mangrovi]
MNKLCVISIYVSDLSKAKEFYCEKLGFEISREYDENTVSLQHDSIPIVLFQVDQPSTIEYPQQSQVVLGMQTDNITASIQELESQGIEVIYKSPQACPVGYYTAFKDPFGNVIELLEFK